MAKNNHHYVPQGYLRGFTIAGERSLVWEYDKDTGKISRHPKSVRDICSENHYYAQRREDGSRDHESVENAFHVIENRAPQVIRGITFTGNGGSIELVSDDRVVLSFFAALQLFRVPNFRDGIEQLHRRQIEILLAEIIRVDKASGTLPPTVEQAYEHGGIEIDIERDVSLEPMIKLASECAISLQNKIWQFVAPAEGMTFVTSDNPVYFQLPEKYQQRAPSSVGPMHPLAEVSIPLRSDLALIVSPVTQSTCTHHDLSNDISVQLDKNDTKNINKRTATAAARYVYSSENSRALARMAGKLKGVSQRLIV